MSCEWCELYETIKYRQNCILVGEIIDILNIYALLQVAPSLKRIHQLYTL